MNSALISNYERVSSEVAMACSRSGRPRESVELIAVSKTVDGSLIQAVHEAGQRHFAESRLQEAQPKIDHLPKDIAWHFIGSMQRNKVRRIVGLFSWIHSVDSLRLAAYMDGIARDLGMRPRIFLEVNLGEESAKSGFSVDTLKSGFATLIQLSHLEIVGLMCIPPQVDEPEAARPYFRRLRELRDELQNGFSHPLPFLSMGMSHDFTVAIEEGATHVRVGTSIFGDRATRTPS